MDKQEEAPKKIVNVLNNQHFPKIKFPGIYQLVNNLKKNGKDVLGKIDGRTISINSFFKEDKVALKIIYLHECFHFIFGETFRFNNNTMPLRNYLRDDDIFFPDRIQYSNKSLNIYNDCEELIVRYATYIFFKNNLALLNSITEKKLREKIKEIDNFGKSGEKEDSFGCPIKYGKACKNKNENNLWLICWGLFYEKKNLPKHLKQKIIKFKKHMPKIDLAIKEILENL